MDKLVKTKKPSPLTLADLLVCLEQLGAVEITRVADGQRSMVVEYA